MTVRRLFGLAALVFTVGFLPRVVAPEIGNAAGTVGAAGRGLNLGFGKPAFEHVGVIPNNGFADESYDTTSPGNYDFEGASLSPWTSPTNGFSQIGTGGNPGKYAKAIASGPTLESGSWTVASDSQTISWDDIKTGTGGTYAVRIWNGSTETTLASLVTATTSWTTRTYNVYSFVGQTVTIRFKSVANGVGFDNVKVRAVEPGWVHDATGTNVLTLDGQGNPLVKGGSFTSSSFTIPSDAQAIAYRSKRVNGTSSTYSVQLLTGVGFGTPVTVKASLTADTDDFREQVWSIEAWAGQTVKLRFSSISNTLGLDDVQIGTAVPGWDVGSLQTVPQERPGGPAGGYVHAQNGIILTSQPSDFGTELYFWRSLRSPGLVGGNSCVQVFAFNADDDSVIGDYDSAVGDCDSPTNAWEQIPSGLNLFSEWIPNYHGGLVYIEVHISGTAGFDLISDGSGNHPGYPSADSKDPVDTASGDFVHNHNDFTVPGRGVPLQFTRYYDSGTGSDGPLGANWSHTYDVSLDIQADFATVHYAEGYRVPFEEAGGGAYDAPDGTFDTLAASGGGYVLTRKDQTVYTFDSGGALQSIEDRNGNTTTLDYDANGRLQTVTDAGGRQLTFTYDAVVGGGAARGQPLKPFTNADFESGNFTNWTKTGTAFGSSPGTEPVYSSRYGNSGAGGNSATGTLLSTSFTAGHLLTMRIGGHVDASNLYVALVDGGVEVAPQASTNGVDTMTTVSFDTSAYAGDSVQIKVVDTSTTGHLLVDDFAVVYSDHLRQVDLPLGRSVQFDYDANGNLWKVTDVRGGVTEYNYVGGQMTKLTDANDHEAVRNFYDNGGRVWKQLDALGNLTCFYYGWGPATTDVACPGASSTPTGARTVIVDPNGNETTYAADDLLRTIEIRDPLGETTELVYDDDNNITCVIDALDRKTGYTYDSTGNVTHVIDAQNTDTDCELDTGADQWTMTYTAKNDLDLLTDPLGRQVDFVYDGSGNLTQVKRLDDMSNVVLWTCFSPDTNGDVLEVIESTTLTNCTGNTTTFTYDTDGNVETITDPVFDGVMSPPQAVLDWDAGSRLESITNELGHTTTFTYDEANAVLTVEDEDSHTTTYTYDARGNLTSIEDPNLNLTEYEYDDADRLERVIDAMLEHTAYDYDGNGNLISVLNARGKETTYAYDELNRLELITDPLDNETAYTYDEVGDLETRIDGRGWETEYTFDELHRLTNIDHIGSADDVTFTYDEVGNRETMVDPTGTTTYTYTALNLPETIEFPGSRVVTYTYDETGRREQIEYPDTKTVDYTYDEAGRMETVTDWLSNVTEYTYDDAGMLDTVELPSGVITDYGYDTSDRLTDIVTTGPGPTTLVDLTYTLDAAGVRSDIADAVASGSYHYDFDDLYRLTGAEYPDTSTESFAYDEVGNRTDHDGATYTYDDADQLQSIDALMFDYDENGNMTARGSDTFEYDFENRLVEAAVGGADVTAAYDGDGLRQNLTVDATTTDYVWDTARRIPQVLQDGAFTYVYGLDLISSVDGSGHEVYYSQDALGSSTAITDDAGAGLGSYQYRAFGEVLDHTGDDADPWLFAGEQRDATLGFDYLRARYYDPAIGRFITRDPWPGNRAHPSTQTAYPYVVNHPTGLVDPSGRCFGWDWCEDQVEAGWDSLSSAAGDVGGVIAANYGPPFNFSRVSQLADLVGTEGFCYGGAVGIGALGGFGAARSLAAACRNIDKAVSVTAFVTTEWGILQSDCGFGRKALATGLNGFNLRADLDELTWKRRAAYEHGLYVTTNSVNTCAADAGSTSKE